FTLAADQWPQLRALDIAEPTPLSCTARMSRYRALPRVLSPLCALRWKQSPDCAILEKNNIMLSLGHVLVIDLTRCGQQGRKCHWLRSPIQPGPILARRRKPPMFRTGHFASVIFASVGLAGPVLAQSTVYIPAILELSGAGAVSGTNFRDGMLLAIDEINAKGGILGKKIETPLLDTQSDAGISRAQVQKVL